MRKSFERAKKKAGIDPKFRRHDFRHTGASCLVMSGVELYVVQEILEHRSIETT